MGCLGPFNGQYRGERLFHHNDVPHVRLIKTVLQLEVGDYGTVEADGHFKCKGNIYRLGRLMPLMKTHPPVVTEGDKAGNVISITSSNAKMVNINPGFSVDAHLAEVKFEVGLCDRVFWGHTHLSLYRDRGVLGVGALLF